MYSLYTLDIINNTDSIQFTSIMSVDSDNIIQDIYKVDDVGMTNLLYTRDMGFYNGNRTTYYQNSFYMSPQDTTTYREFITEGYQPCVFINAYDSTYYTALNDIGVGLVSMGSTIDAYFINMINNITGTTTNVNYIIYQTPVVMGGYVPTILVYDPDDKTDQGFYYWPYSTTITITPYTPSCFLRDTMISTIDGDVAIQEIQKGDIVPTLCSGNKKVLDIGVRNVKIPENTNDPSFKVFEYPEGLRVTGKHSILVDELTEEQIKQIPSIIGSLKQTEGKWLLPVCLDIESTQISTNGNVTLYHIVLENDDDKSNYGILSHGKWVETCSKNDFEKYIQY